MSLLEYLVVPKKLFNCMQDPPETFWCKNCNFKTSLFIVFKKHLEEHEGGSQIDYTLRSFICGSCSFHTNSSLHWIKHSCDASKNELMKFKCDHSLRLKCEDIEWFKCDQRSYQARLKVQLKRHVKKHLNPKDIDQSKRKKNHSVVTHLKEDDNEWLKCDQFSSRILPTNSESEERESVSPILKRRKKINKQWKKEKIFDDKTSAVQVVKSEEIWSFFHKNVDKDGNVNDIYRCNKVKYRGEQCQAGIYLSYPSDSTEVILYRSQLAHTCNNIPTQSKNKISEEVRNEIKSLFGHNPKIKPKRIMETLAEKQLTLPKITDLNNMLALLRKDKFGHRSINLGELEQFFIDNSRVPEDEKKGFVVSYEVNYEEPSYFRFFVSSKTLMNLARNARHIQADATHKFTWQGFSVRVVGTTDASGQFYPFGLAISSNEQTEDFVFLFKALKSGTVEEIRPKTLVTDATLSIQSAFKQIFGAETLIVMCWAHVRKNTQKRAEQLCNKSDVRKIITDLELLQLSKNEAVFEQASRLFTAKWKNEQEDFVKYFQKEWLDCNRNWFEGVSNHVPSTNNALASFTRVIKEENTLRERLSFDRFSITMMEYIERWSNTHRENLHPNVNLDLWTKAYRWVKQEKEIIIENTSVYFSPSEDKIAINHDHLERKRKMEFSTFDEYKEVMFSTWVTTLPDDQQKWMEGTCDCPVFLKNQICMHLVGIALRMKIATPPAAALGEKRRRGRPAKSKRALLLQ